MTIPKRIIQTARSASLPLLSRSSSSTIRLHNLDFEYLFFDDDDVERLIKAYYPEYVDVFNSFPLKIQKYDFFRYLAVYKYGGFYFDLDVFLATSLAPLLRHGCVLPFERLTWSRHLQLDLGIPWEVGNYAFGGTPGHPFLRCVIENCVRSQREASWTRSILSSLPFGLREELTAIYTTGPGMLTLTLAHYQSRESPVAVLFPPNISDRASWNQFGEYGIHLGEGSWRVRHNSLRRRAINMIARRAENRIIKSVLGSDHLLKLSASVTPITALAN